MCKIDQFSQEEIRDLLSKDQTKRLELKERPDTGVYVKVRRTVCCNIVITHVKFTRINSQTNCRFLKFLSIL